jgi:hypothetical protein
LYKIASLSISIYFWRNFQLLKKSQICDHFWLQFFCFIYVSYFLLQYYSTYPSLFNVIFFEASAKEWQEKMSGTLKAGTKQTSPTYEVIPTRISMWIAAWWAMVSANAAAHTTPV